MADAQKVEIGFEGGQVISVRLSDDELKDLRKQVEKGGWHDVKTEDGVLALYVGKVSFLRIDSGEHRSASRRAGLMRGRSCSVPPPGDAGRGALVAQEPVGLPLRPALLGRSPAPDHHPRPPALRAAPRAGERVLEIGPGVGYYTLDMAEWVGPEGKIEIFDLQQEFLDHVGKRAAERGLTNITPPRATPRPSPTRTTRWTPWSSPPSSARSPTRSPPCARSSESSSPAAA